VVVIVKNLVFRFVRNVSSVTSRSSQLAVERSSGTERRELSLVQGARAAPGRVSLIQTRKAGRLFLFSVIFILVREFRIRE
jgi:hypothetical protein